MVEDNMDIYALDSGFNLVTIAIPYSNLQWNRRYYEAGKFEVEIPLALYDPTWAYIGTSARPELGMIQKIEVKGEGDTSVLLSGFFCEKMLDDKTCYPRYKGDVAHTETAVRNIFAIYKEDLPISLGEANNPLLGDRTQSDFSDDEMGKKLYAILEPRQMSYRVRYDYDENKLYFEVWQGLDRTQSQSVNGFQTFSTEFGNIIDRDITLDDSAYKNYAIIPVNSDDNDVEQDTFYIDWSDGGYKKKIVFNMRSSRPDEDQTYEEFKAAILSEASEKLLGYQKVEDVNIDPVGGGYMLNYDLGDKCDVVLTDLGVTMEIRIVEVNEVFKPSDGHTVTVGLGNKRINNIRRVVRR